MKVESSLRLIFDCSENAQIFYDSFMPEFESLPMKRSHWEINPPRDNLTEINFQISSDDETAFRATINSVIQFAHIIETTIGLIK
jgi:tRNA threonylcarbamoyladenosine modification (KEOPS) complex  Pcc1 subunit